MTNPLLEEFQRAKSTEEAARSERDELVQSHAWAVPTSEAIEAVAKLSPIVEVGAGSGYWAALLREAGANVQAFDISPFWTGRSGYSFRTAYAPIARGDERRAMRMYGDRTLLICWPPMSGMAANALRLHRGEHLVYIGESWGGCNADDNFFVHLETNYVEVEHPPIPRWPGLHDYCTIYRRKEGEPCPPRTT